jgi:hypothetical protein
LKEFHSKEKENSGSQFHVVGLGVDPPGAEEPNGGKAGRHFTSETHL